MKNRNAAGEVEFQERMRECKNFLNRDLPFVRSAPKNWNCFPYPPRSLTTLSYLRQSSVVFGKSAFPDQTFAIAIERYSE